MPRAPPWIRVGGGRHDHGAARGDLIEKAGLKMPATFEQLVQVCEATNGKDGVAAFVADKLHHWNWIPYLMGFGGRVFRTPRTISRPCSTPRRRPRRRSTTPTCS